MRGALYDVCVQLLAEDAQHGAKGLGALEAIVRSASTDEEQMMIFSQFADILWLQEVRLGDDDREGRSRLASLVAAIAEHNLIPDELLRERLEAEVLEGAGLLPSAQLFNKKQIRINTSMLYKQQKYNLLREESEGFAKLICVLFDASPRADAGSLFEQVVSLVGYFDLDPNRVLDLIIDVFAQSPPSKFRPLLGLLSRLDFAPATVSNIAGFKFAFVARDSKGAEILQPLALATALMLRHGICTLEGVYAHLSPSDEETAEEALSISAKIRLAARTFGTAALGGGEKKETPKDIAQDHLPVCHDVALEIAKAVGSANQKAHLLAALLCVGDFGRARLLLEKLPPAITSLPFVAQSLCTALHHIIEPHVVRTAAVATTPRYLAGLADSGFAGLAGFADSVGFAGLQPSLPASSGLGMDPDPALATDAEAKAKAPLLPTLLLWLRYLQSGLYLDPVLVAKICRIGREVLLSSPSELARRQWLAIIVHHLLPAITLVSSNPAMANEIWEMLRLFPYQTRFAVYGIWRTELYEKSPELSLAKSIVTTDIRRIMRRLTKENVKQYGRLIAKISHSNPTIVFPIILDQLQAYDNLIQPVVDSLKYLTPLGFDVLAYILVDSLANPAKERLKDDGTNLSMWLQGLAVFAGSLYRRYATVDAEAIIQYIVNQLHDENSFDLVILSELIYRMGGVESIENISDAHLDALAGGPLLRAETITQQAKPNKRSVHRLVQILSEKNLAVPLWILLAQQRNASIYKGGFTHIKLIHALLDQDHKVFLQYSSLLAASIPERHFAFDDLPELQSLTTDYRIDTDLACFMRRSWERAFFAKTTDTPTPTATSALLSSLLDRPFPPQIIAGQTSTALRAGFFRVFWFLELADISVPAARYSTEALRLKTFLSSSSAPHHQSHSAALSEAEGSKWRRERERAPQTILALEAEVKQQAESVAATLALLSTQKHAWFCEGATRGDIVGQIYMRCVLQRALMSPADAVYSAKFVLLLHALNTPGFSSLNFLDRVVADLAGVLTAVTEKEAHNYARFLEILFSQLSQWHSDEAAYQKEAIGAGLCGFCKRPPGTAVVPEDGAAVGTSDLLSYEDYRHLVYKWHLRMHRTVVAAFESREYIQIKNSIIILTRISASFPAIRKIGLSVERALLAARDAEKREDLKVMAARYLATLALSKAKWCSEEDFHHLLGTARTESGEIAEERPGSADGGRKRGSENDPEDGEDDEDGEEPPVKRMMLQSPRELAREHSPGGGGTKDRDRDRDRDRERERERDREPAHASTRYTEEFEAPRPRERESRLPRERPERDLRERERQLREIERERYNRQRDREEHRRRW